MAHAFGQLIDQIKQYTLQHVKYVYVCKGGNCEEINENSRVLKMLMHNFINQSS